MITAWCTREGTIAHEMVDQDRRSSSLANLQPKMHFPGKAYRRWQLEFIDAAASGLYAIEEIR